jgi:hypothetical protein
MEHMHTFSPHDPFGMVIAIVIIACATGVIMELLKIASRRTGASADALDAYEKRLARVEVAIDDLTAAVGRVSEGQQFLTNILSERAAMPVMPPRS